MLPSRHAGVIGCTVATMTISLVVTTLRAADLASDGTPQPATSKPSTAARPKDPTTISGLTVPEEVVVVAKRTQNLRNIAGTVNILTGRALEKVGARDAEDIFKLTPGVQFDKGSSDGSLLTIRGVGFNTASDNVSNGQLPTGVYIEDVPFTDPYQYVSTPDVSAFDLDSVKVLRGPQGALYGSGSLGGAIDYVYRKPDTSRYGGVIEADMENAEYGDTTGSVYGEANLPLVRGQLALRVVGQYQNEPGYQPNIGTGQKDANGRTVESERFLLRYTPTVDLTIDALYARQRSYQDDTSASFEPNARFYDTPLPTRYDSRFNLGVLEGNYVYDWLKITSISGYQTKTRNQIGDISRLLIPDATVGFDAPSEDAFGFGPLPQVKVAKNIDLRSSRGFSQEIRLASAEHGVFNWLVGVFGQNIYYSRFQDVLLEGANDPAVGDLFFNVDRDGRTEERSVFGEGEIDLGKFVVSAGGRYFDTSLRFHQTNLPAFESSKKSRYFSEDQTGFTPKFQVRYRFNREVLAYAVASKGFRFGGVNTTPDGKPFVSDSLWSYEAGLRLDPARTLNLQFAAFYVDWKNAQVTTADQNGFIIITNVRHALSKGLELSGAWHPIDGLTLNGNATYTQAITRSPLLSTANFATDAAGGFTGNFVIPGGTRLPGTPKFQSTAQADYVMPAPYGSQADFNATLSYIGDRRAQIDSDLRLPHYITLDLRASLARGPWEGAVSIQNVFNTDGLSAADFNYYSTGIGKQGYADYFLIRPRIFGLSLRRTF